MRFVYTAHALEMLTERTIEKGWVERVILIPDAAEQDPKHADRIRSFGTIPERDNRVLRVVYVPSGSTIRVITLFFDRRRRR